MSLLHTKRENRSFLGSRALWRGAASASAVLATASILGACSSGGGEADEGNDGSAMSAMHDGGRESSAGREGKDSGQGAKCDKGTCKQAGGDASDEEDAMGVQDATVGSDAGKGSSDKDAGDKDSSGDGSKVPDGGKDAGLDAMAAEAGCSPGALSCNGEQPQSCAASGTWRNVGSPCSGSTPACLNGACAACDPGALGCSGQQPQTCQPNGTWANSGAACAGAACVGGVCAGTCSPATNQCMGTAVQTCGSDGTWGTAVACSDTCAAGMCTGACTAGTTQCSGTSAVQTCVAGMWGTATACTAQACVSGICTGTCSPGNTQCISDTQVETCGTDGQWETATTCLNACVGTAGGACGGVCAPGTMECTSDTQVATCDTTGQWGAATTCTDACVGTIGAAGGSCGGVCVPGATDCSGTCGSTGQWTVPPCTSDQTCVNSACVATATTTGTSCQTSGGGLTNCGASSESCCTSLAVPGGTYYRTYANSGTGPTGEADPATVSGFRLDKYLVTTGRFLQFKHAVDMVPPTAPAAVSGKHTYLNSGNGLNTTGGGYEPGWDATDWNPYIDGHTVTTDANLNSCGSSSTWANNGTATGLVEPMNCVTWYEAYGFCIWDGGFLPSEAEWEYAAAGGNQQREYPWGTMDPGTANQYAIYESLYAANPTEIAPVGTATLGAGAFGQLDMAGEVFEWNLDYYAGAYVDPCIDCANLSGTSTSARVRSGGAFNSVTITDLLPAYRAGGSVPSSRVNSIGFRCARTP
jgi:formylglycine-generating enzyme required for sulfatase activity